MAKKLKCVVASSNMMQEASHKSELRTQLFYNDRVEYISKSGAWIEVKNKFNHTNGWVLEAQFVEISEEVYLLPNEYICDVNECTLQLNDVSTKILPGTFFFSEEHSVEVFKGQIKVLDRIERNETTMQTILFSYLNVPYMWGGMTHAGIDCSGLSQMLYRFLGIGLTSFAAEQIEHGTVLDFLQDAQCGDLAFFENGEGHIDHVGVLLNAHELIHATESAGKVVIDAIDTEGITSKRTGKRTHKLRVIKRL